MARSIYCSTCKKEKEPNRLNDSTCKECRSEQQRLLRIKKREASGKPLGRQAHCDECKQKQVEGQVLHGRCIPCTVIMNKIKLHEKRALEGKEPVGIRDSSFCHTCNIPKINGRCVPCRQRLSRERKATRRAEAGKRPWGEGRTLTCYKCEKVKENPKSSLCFECQSAYNKERWAKVISVKSNRHVRTGLCGCGKERASYSKTYCKECISQRNKELRAVLHKVGAVLKKQPAMTPEQKKLRQAARNLVNSSMRYGYLVQKPCEVCGTEVNIEAHHDDYTKPLDVRWLCKTHHDEHHLNERLEKQNAYT